MIREYKAQGWNIGNIEIAKDAQRAGRCLNRLVTGLWVLDISNGVADTIQAYREHKDWVGVAEKESLELLTSEIVGIGVKALVGFIGFTPVGWGATIGLGAIEGATILVADYDENGKVW